MISEDIALQMTLRDGISRGLAGIKDKLLSIGLAYLTWNTAKDVIGGIIKGTAEAEKVQVNLEAAVKRHGITWKTWADQVETASIAAVRLTGTSDELYKQGLQKLIDAKMPMEQALKTMATAMDFAKASSMGLEESAGILSKAFLGATGALSRYGIVVDDSVPKAEKFKAVMQQLNERFGGAAQADMNTFDGQLRRLSETFGNLGEAFGEGVKITQILASSFAWLSTWLENIPKLVRDTINDWKAWYEFVISMPKAIVESFSAMGTAIHDILERPWDAINIGEGAFERIKNAGISVKDAFVNVGTTLKTHLVDVMSASALASIEFDKVWEHFGQTIQSTTNDKIISSLGKLSQAWKDFRYEVSYGFRDQPDVDKQLEALSNQLTAGLDEVDWRQREAIERAEGRVTKSNKKILDSTKKTYIDMGKAFEIGFSDAVSRGVNYIAKQFGFLRDEAQSIWEAMAQDFVAMFIETVLEQTAKFFVVKLLDILGSIFDTPANDRMAMKQGEDFAKYFTQGMTAGLSGVAQTMTGALAMPSQSYMAQLAMPSTGRGGGSTVNVYVSGNMTPEFIQKNIVDTIQRASNNGFGGFKYDAGFKTGNSVIAFN